MQLGPVRFMVSIVFNFLDAFLSFDLDPWSRQLAARGCSLEFLSINPSLEFSHIANLLLINTYHMYCVIATFECNTVHTAMCNHVLLSSSFRCTTYNIHAAVHYWSPSAFISQWLQSQGPRDVEVVPLADAGRTSLSKQKPSAKRAMYVVLEYFGLIYVDLMLIWDIFPRFIIAWLINVNTTNYPKLRNMLVAHGVWPETNPNQHIMV